LYAKIAPTGAACTYIVPFAYQNGCIQLANATERMAWIGGASTDWANACNWSPVGVPSATNPVEITNVTRKPIIGSGVMAMAKNILLLDTLTVNRDGTLTISDLVTNDYGIRLRDYATLTNNGTISITSNIANTYGIEYGIAGTQTFTNSGNLTLGTTLRNVIMAGNNSSFVNNANGVITIQGGIGLYFNDATAVKNVSNQGIINYSGTGAFMSGKLGTTFTNTGTLNITSGLGIVANGGTFNNPACSKIIMRAGSYDNSLAGSTVNNAGLLQIPNTLNNTAGTFNNTGVVRYGTLTGTITSNQNSSIIIRNSMTPIFSYGGTYDGTVNGIYRDSFATVSAGKFTAPNDFIPSPSLPTGTQTLYVRLTPNGEACAYIVPFTYMVTRTATKDVSDGTVLHQNRPNPFSQQTVIPFVLSETNKAVLTVYDLNGRQVFTANKDFQVGYNEVLLNKFMFQTTGIYFYRLTTDKYSVVKRLQFVAE
jgi:Secretion system C-terminal sorting domain